MADQNQTEQPQGMAQHHASVTVNAPVHQVYSMFTHFTDFPKFMHFVKEVNYVDSDHSRTHWTADVIGQHEWDAVDENWVPDRQIGWRSYNGLENEGKVTFQPAGVDQTQVDVYIDYNPPLGLLGDIGEKLGAGSRFEHDLQNDLDNFARMVENAPSGSLNPDSSSYLFHRGSAEAGHGQTSQPPIANPPGVGMPAGYASQPDMTNLPGSAQQNTTMQEKAKAYPPSESGASTLDNPYTMGQPGMGVERPYTTDQTMMGQPQEDYLTGEPLTGDDVVVEVYEIDVLPTESSDYDENSAFGTGAEAPAQGWMNPSMVDDTVGTPPPNPTNPMMPPEGTVYPVMPNASGTPNPVMPSTGGVRNPVTPPEGSTRNPVMPPEGGARNPVMPPESGKKNPVMPPEKRKNDDMQPPRQ